jgi:prephenate dehydrogenase
VHWKKVALIGVGLLGGSLGLALKRRGLAERVVGFVRRPASIRECQACGAVDEATLDLAQAVAGADLVVFCTPLSQMQGLVRQMLPALAPGALVTDVGSVKASVVAQVESMAAKAGAHFVGGHPMAGSEKTGVSASREDLFVNAVCVITPTAKSNRKAVAQVERLWRMVGGCPLRVRAQAHDELVARSSHLPHVVAAGLARGVLDPKHGKQQAVLCATGFRDTTRVASGSPEMWRDIVLANRKSLGRALNVFIKDLGRFRRAMERGDERAITAFFAEAKQRRDLWAARGLAAKTVE